MTSDAAKIALPALRETPPPPAAEAPRAYEFSRAQKAAMIIAALGRDAAGPVVERIGEKQLRVFAEAYARLNDIPHQTLAGVIAEFVETLDGDKAADLKGGFDETRELIASLKGAESADKILDDVDAPGGRTVWQKLESFDEKLLCGYLAGQHPQTVTVVLSRLDMDKASSLLSLLPDELSEDVLLRLSKPMSVRREALRVLADSIEQDFLLPARKAKKVRKPGEIIGSMLNNLPDERRAAMLALIEAKAPDLLDDVKSYIMTFADIPTRVPANAVPQILREVDVQSLLKAAKYGRQNAPETIEFLFANISQRMVQQYEEQMTELKPVTVPEAEAAQAEIMVALRRLASAGEFELIKPQKADEPTEVFI